MQGVEEYFHKTCLFESMRQMATQHTTGIKKYSNQNQSYNTTNVLLRDQIEGILTEWVTLMDTHHLIPSQSMRDL